MLELFSFIPFVATAIQSDRLSAIKRYNNQIDGSQGLIAIAIIFVSMVAIFFVLRFFMQMQKRKEEKQRKAKNSERSQRTSTSRR